MNNSNTKNDKDTNKASVVSKGSPGKSLKDLVLESQGEKRVNKSFQPEDKIKNNNGPNQKPSGSKTVTEDEVIKNRRSSVNDSKLVKERSSKQSTEKSDIKAVKEEKQTVKASKGMENNMKPEKISDIKKHRISKTTVFLTVLCVLSLLFSADVITAAGMKAFFMQLSDSSKDIDNFSSADVDNKDVPVIIGTGQEAIEKGKLDTNITDEQERLNQIAEDSRVYCIISSSPYFDSADSKGSLFISNPEESRFYTQVVIKSKDTEREMYVSPVLAPDEKIEYDYLTNKTFEKGQHPANAYFNYYTKTGDNGTRDDYKYIGTMCAEVLIVID